MLRLTMYAFGIDLDRTLRYKVKKKFGYDWDSDHSVGYMDPYVLHDDTIDEFDIISGMISYMKDIDNLRVTQNQFNKKVKLNCWLVVISDESFKLIQYQYYHGQLKKELISEYSLDEFKHGYAYVVRNADGYYNAVSYKDAYQYGKTLGRRFIIAKMSVNHVRSDYTNCDGMSDCGLDNYYVYDNYKPFDPSNPLDYYDYCMSIVAMELQFYTKDGTYTGGRWSNGSGKTFYDFMNPDRIKEMADVQCPIYYDPIEYAMYAD